MAITIQQLVNALDAEKLGFQILGNVSHVRTLRGGRRGIGATHLEVKFAAPPENMHREALIIWVDRDDLDKAIGNLKG